MSASADLEAAAHRIADYPEPAVRAAVTALRTPIDQRLKVDTGGDRRLSGAGNAKLSVRTSVRGGTSIVDGRVGAGRPGTTPGPWRWINDGVRPYVTAAGNRHPGTPIKRTWDAPLEQAIPGVEADLAARFDRTI